MVDDTVKQHVWLIYRIRCLITDRAYIGLTRRTLETRWRAHLSNARNKYDEECGMIIGRAIRKHGEDNFTIEVISQHGSQEDADRAERLAIQREGTIHPNGYNVAAGGVGIRGNRRWTRQQRELFGVQQRGKIVPLISRQRMAAARKGLKLSATHKANIGQALTGIPKARTSLTLLKKDPSPLQGVRPTPKGRWMARIKIDGKTTYIGTFDDKETAAKAYLAARDARIAEIEARSATVQTRRDRMNDRIRVDRAAWLERSSTH